MGKVNHPITKESENIVCLGKINSDDGNKNNLSKKENFRKKLKKSVSFFKLQYALMNKKDLFLSIIATLSSIAAGLAMPLFDYTSGITINKLGPKNDKETFMKSISEMCLIFVYIGIGGLVFGFLMSLLWSLLGIRMARKIKEQYFKIIMQQEQAWFDQLNPYEFSQTIQSQLQTIQFGVRILLILS